jgi:hypothetical protein
MKTIRNLKMFAVLIVTSLFLFAGTTYAAKPAAQCLREKFVESVKYPDFQFKTGFGEVNLTFTVSPEGKIEIESLKATDDKLADYVKEQVEKINCADVITQYHQHFSINFRFKTI